MCSDAHSFTLNNHLFNLYNILTTANIPWQEIEHPSDDVTIYKVMYV